MADQFAQASNMVPDSRAEFEAHYGPRWGSVYLEWVEPAGRYAWDATQEAWFVWQAATKRQQSRIQELEAQVRSLKDAANLYDKTLSSATDAYINIQIEADAQRRMRLAAEAQVQALSLDAFAKDASIGHLSRLVDAERTDAARYQWLRGRDLETISHGGVFAGKTPDNVILNGEDLDSAIDAAIDAGKGGQE